MQRQNAVRLEVKEKMEKELLNQIIDEADEYKIEFYRKRTITCENNKTTNREKEKVSPSTTIANLIHDVYLLLILEFFFIL